VKRPERLSDFAVAQWILTNPDWVVEDDRLVARFAISYNHGIDVLMMVRDNVDEYDHHPRVTLEYRQLTIELWTHDRGGITELDLALAEMFARAAHAVSN
jgi:4a-hydroxytetrahydrobiopterin dehydratase